MASFQLFCGVACSAVGAMIGEEAAEKLALASAVADKPWTGAAEAARIADDPKCAGTVVKVHGVVGSDAPLKCGLALDEPAVAVSRVTERGRWLPRGYGGDSFPVSVLHRVSPYYVEPAGAGAGGAAAGAADARVYPRGWDAWNPNLVKVHSHAERSGYPVALTLLAGLFQLPLPYETVHEERVLRVGSDLLAVGVLQRARDGKIAIRPPRGLRRGILTTDDEADVASRLRTQAVLGFGGSAILISAGAALIVGAVQ